MTRKVCFFIGDMQRSGGTERVTAVIASALVFEGFDVSVLSMVHGNFSYYPVNRKIKMYSLKMEKYSSNFSDFIAWIKLSTFLRRQKYDYLVGVDSVLSWYSIPAALASPVRVICWEHFNLRVNVGDTWQRLRRKTGRLLAQKFAYSIVALTNKDREEWLKRIRGDVDLRVIPNPVTIENQPRSSLESKIVLAVGRLERQKGFDLLIDAWSRLPSDCSSWILKIVGSGSEENSLKQLIKWHKLEDKINLVPHSSAVSEFFVRSSIYACSSRFEGLPLVLIEAKSSGLPIVSFDCDFGPSEIVRDGVDGMLVTPGDVDKLAAALSKLMKDRNKIRQYGDSAYSDKRFELPVVVQSWIKLLA